MSYWESESAAIRQSLIDESETPYCQVDSEEVLTRWPLTRLQAETAAKLDAVLLSILNHALKGEL